MKTISNGTSTYLWDDPWCSKTSLREILNGRIAAADEELKVGDILENGCWRLDRIHTAIPDSVARRILFVHAAIKDSVENRWIWCPSRNGQFAVKSTYNLNFPVIFFFQFWCASKMDLENLNTTKDKVPDMDGYLWKAPYSCLALLNWVGGFITLLSV